MKLTAFAYGQSKQHEATFSAIQWDMAPTAKFIFKDTVRFWSEIEDSPQYFTIWHRLIIQCTLQ